MPDNFTLDASDMNNIQLDIANIKSELAAQNFFFDSTQGMQLIAGNGNSGLQIYAGKHTVNMQSSTEKVTINFPNSMTNTPIVIVDHNASSAKPSQYGIIHSLTINAGSVDIYLQALNNASKIKPTNKVGVNLQIIAIGYA
jgi:hypothetical protein